MDEKDEREVEDMFDQVSDDLVDSESQDRDIHKKKESGGFRLTGPSAVILGLGLVVVVVLLVMLFRGGTEVNTGDMESLRARVSQVEARLIRIDTTVPKTGPLEEKINALSESLAKLESSERALRAQVDKLSQAIEKMPEKQAPVVTKKEVTPPPSQTKGRYHEVSRGETLYRIAKQYKISVDQLRRMNNLKENQAIYVGQKLLVALEGK